MNSFFVMIKNLKTFRVLSIFIFVLLIGTSLQGQGNETSSKKNVLFIAIDDLRPQLGCYGNEQMQTPSIDQIADEGLLFDRAYCQQAICSPSRISLLTGLRCETTKIYGLKILKKDKLPDIVSLPAHFKNNGYQTLSIGKIYHHAQDDPEAWSKPPFRAMKGSGYITEEGKEIVTMNRKTNPNSGTKGPVSEAADVPDNGYSDGKLADRAIEELRAMNGKPFFLALGFRKPHLPFTAPKKYWDLYNPQELKLAENKFFPEGATPYTMNNFGELRNYYNMPRGKERVDDELARHLIHGYYACVSFIDAQIGRVVDELGRLGLKENTIIVLWGDHGWKLGEHDSWCKHTNFEIDCRAPLIISDPQITKNGKRTRALTEFIDIYPTLCELTGLPEPGHLEGYSLKPLMENPDLEWKKAAFSIWVQKKYRYDMDTQIIGYAMKTDRYRYIEWRHTKTGDIKARELYDHQLDPDENRNVIDKEEYAETVVKLEAQMRQGKNNN
jgi:arylsulfatase A-like enzyme